MAMSRQIALEKKFKKNPDLHQAYNKIIRDLQDQEHLRKATSTELDTWSGNKWYLPTGIVVNQNKNPPKPRIIYDARSKYKNISLNDCLLKGPDLLINQIHPLIGMRLNEVAVCADVKSMFHQVKICPRDVHCQRILFRQKPSDQMETLLMTSMAFGPTCSPFASQYVKNQAADKWESKHKEAANVLKKATYMDDIIFSAPSVQQASLISKNLITILDDIKWELNSFQSNNRAFLESLPKEAVKAGILSLLAEESDDEYATKVLGCNWDPKEDAFLFTLNKSEYIKSMSEFDSDPTKRDLASLLARIYDILGFIAHFTVRGKILLQKIWRAKISWDDKLSTTRKLVFRSADKIQLHVSCDAGDEAHGVVAHLVVHKDEDVQPQERRKAGVSNLQETTRTLKTRTTLSYTNATRERTKFTTLFRLFFFCFVRPPTVTERRWVFIVISFIPRNGHIYI
jgi:hypothetical protein